MNRFTKYRPPAAARRCGSRSSALVLALVVVLVGCGNRDRSEPVVFLACADAIGAVANPGAGDSVIFDQVALPTERALQANPSGEADSTVRLFAKNALLVRSDASFEQIVPDEWHGRLTIGWGSPAKRTDHLKVSGCRSSSPDRSWLAFAGGYWIDEPACVELIVKAGQGEQREQIGVGAPCSGQAPPPPGM